MSPGNDLFTMRLILYLRNIDSNEKLKRDITFYRMRGTKLTRDSFGRVVFVECDSPHCYKLIAIVNYYLEYCLNCIVY